MASELFPSVVRGSAASPPVRTGFEIGRVARFGGNINCNELEIRIGGKSIASATAQKDTYLFSTKSGRRLETEQREQKIVRGYGQFTDSVGKTFLGKELTWDLLICVQKGLSPKC